MNLAGILGFRRRSPPTPAQLRELLTSTQIGWLGALLLSAQLPQAPHLPIWVAVTGILLVVVRLVVLRHDRQRPQAPPPRIPSWTLVVFAVAAAFAVRASFGYLSGRDPSVAFLYILVAIKFLETRTTRDGALLVCLSCFLLITPFFYGQSLLAAIAVLPAVVLVGATLDAMTNTSGNDGAKTDRSAAVRRSAFMILQGVPIAILLFVLFPRLAGPLWGLPADHSAQTGLSETMEPGQISELSLSDAVAFRVDFDGTPPPPRERYWRGPVLVPLRRPGLDCGQHAIRWSARPRGQHRHFLYSHPGTLQPRVALRTRSAGLAASYGKRYRQGGFEPYHRHAHPRSAAPCPRATDADDCAMCSNPS